MVETIESAPLPPAPRSPLPYLQQVKAIRAIHTGPEKLREAGGPVTRCTLAPTWMTPAIVVVTSPKGAHDVMGRPDAFFDKTLPLHEEMRRVMGSNLFNLPHDAWLPRRRALQSVFTKRHVAAFAGHMAEAADRVPRGWRDGADIDLDTECRTLALRVLGRAVLGLDLDERADALAAPLVTVTKYAVDRALAPVRAPRWLPTPGRHRARAASSALHRLAAEIVQGCRADPTRDAPLVHALIAATDPGTGLPLSDAQICDELLIFLLAGHDTTATLLTYALWALGHHRDLQDRVAAEVAALGDRTLTPEDLPRLGYTVRVLHEALRLCPPGAAAGRMAMQDVEIDGHLVPAGTMVLVGIYALHRDPALWDNAMVFDPDRFSPENSHGRDRWQYLPFGGGPRSCIGDHFAMLEATLGLATIIRRTEVQSLDEDFPLAVPFTMTAAAPIPARVCSRAEPFPQPVRGARSG